MVWFVSQRKKGEKSMKRLMAVVLLAWATSLSVLAGDLEFGFHYGDTQSGAAGDIAPYVGYLRNVGTSDLYLNSWSFVPDPAEDWSQLWVDSFLMNGPVRLAPGEGRVWGNILQVSIGTNAVPGMYNAAFTVLGGADQNAQDELGTLLFHLEVVDDYHFNVEIPNPDRVAAPGETVVYSHRYVNQGARDIVFTTFWTAVFGNWPPELEHQFLYGSLLWAAPAGQTLETEVFSFRVSPSVPLGVYRGAGGVYGGYYPGDYHEFGDEWTLTVVPEPSGLVALFGGITSLGALVRFRRKR